MPKIYLSATYRDLQDYRNAVYRILRTLRHDVISMEDYVASDAYPLHKCLADVASCQLYVGLIGWRYGYQPAKDNPEQLSITELEYRQAGESGLPRLLFLIDESVAWPDEFRDSHTGEGEAGKRIAAFRAELETEKLVSHVKNPDHLAGLVSAAVQNTLASLQPPKPSARPALADIQRQALQKRLDALLQDYQAATEQLSYTLSAVAQNQIKRQIASIERELEELQTKIELLG